MAVDHIDFDVEEGEIFGFLGANGAGKSTTIRMLCGILPPSSGKAELLGIDVKQHPDRIKQSIGYMSQKFSLYSDLTVKENIEFFGGIHNLGRETLQERTRDILKMAELTGKEKVMTSSLPGGWKQKLALGCSMIHRPKVLFLDEPTAGVDPASRRMFWKIIHELRDEGTTIFVTSHYMDEVEQCDRVALMHRGSIAALGSPMELKRDVIPGSVLYVLTDNQVATREILVNTEGLIRTDPFGRGFHCIVDSRQSRRVSAVERNIRKNLEAAGVKADQIRSVEPGLEDVFVYLIGSLEEKEDVR